MNSLQLPIHRNFRFLCSLRGLLAAGLAIVLLGRSTPAQAAFQITFTTDPSVPVAQAVYLNTTIAGWYEANITTPISVSIFLTYGTTNLGANTTGSGTVTYSQYLSALQSHSSGDANDVSALASLPAGPNNPADGTSSMQVTTANLRALGFTAPPSLTASGVPAGTPGAPGTYDGVIVMSNAPGTFYYSNLGGTQPSNEYNFYTAVEHQVNEVLGLGSGLVTNGPTLSSTGAEPEDLFRYSAPGVHSYGPLGTAGMTGAYFSVNGGVTNLNTFNNLANGSEAGSWVPIPGTPQVQDDPLTPGTAPLMVPGNVETTALDVIGYNFAGAGGAGAVDLVDVDRGRASRGRLPAFPPQAWYPCERYIESRLAERRHSAIAPAHRGDRGMRVRRSSGDGS